MATLPGIVIKVTTDTAKAVQGLNRVNTAMGRTMTRGQKMQATLKRVGPALGTAAAAAGVAAIAIGVDAVQAFMEADAASTRLDKTLENLGLGDRSDEVKQWADDMQYAANIADDELLDGFQKLARAGRDVADAQRDMQLAADVAAGADKDLASVVDALAGAYAGNRGKLVKLGTGLDVAFLKTASLEEVTAKLAGTFGGQNDARNDTLAGAVSGVTNAMGELQESFGAGLVGNIDDTNTSLEETEQRLRDLQPEAERAGDILRNLGLTALEAGGRVVDMFSTDGGVGGVLQRIGEWASMGAIPDDAFAPLTSSVDTAGAAADVAAARYQGLADSIAAANREASRFRVPVGTDWASVDERLKGSRLQYEWAQMDKRNARRAAKRAAAKAARLAKIEDRKHAARTGTKATNSTPGKRSC
jgi:hypothetical protein